MIDNNIADLHPELLRIYRQWLIECHASGLAVKASITWRSGADQDAAKAKGLSNAAAGKSPHNHIDSAGLPSSLAFDFAVFDKDAQPVRDGADPRYKKAGEIGKELGLEWGGDWLKPDWDHLQLANWKEYL